MIDDLKAHNAIVLGNGSGFSGWFSHLPGFTNRQDGFEIELIEKYDSSDAWKTLNEYTYYGEGPEGWTGTSYMVFKVTSGGDTAFYKKEGTCDSYGKESWDLGFYKVQAQRKIVEVWEYTQ
jgi:hypothetical protein